MSGGGETAGDAAAQTGGAAAPPRVAHPRLPARPRTLVVARRALPRGGHRLVRGRQIPVATSAIAEDIGGSITALQWANTIFTLVCGALVIAAGRFGDIFGRRRVLDLGLVLFAAASVVAAVAREPTVLVVGRALMGAGAAAILPATLAIIPIEFAAREQVTAFSAWMAATAVGQAAAPAISGGLTTLIGWPAIFWINLPLCAVALVLVQRPGRVARRERQSLHRLPRPRRDRRRPRRPPLRAQRRADPRLGLRPVLGAVVAAVVLLTAFVLIERRARSRSSTSASSTGARTTARSSTTSPTTSRSPGRCTCSRCPSKRSAATTPSPRGSCCSRRRSASSPSSRSARGWSCAAGLDPAHRGDAHHRYQHVPRRLPASGTPYWWFATGLFIQGVGIGLFSTPLSDAAVGLAPPDEAGAASGAFKMCSMVGGALGVAVLGGVYRAIEYSRSTRRRRREPRPCPAQQVETPSTARRRPTDATTLPRDVAGEGPRGGPTAPSTGIGGSLKIAACLAV